jgi:hypothetical protein
MARTDDPNAKEPKRLDRRALLLGAAAGAAGAAAVGAGIVGLREKARSFVTPASLPEGEAPRIAQSFQDSRPAAETVAKAPAGAPNIVIVVLDDIGFGDLGCYGGEIRTPAMDGLAAKGLRYANFRTCAMCSPTRASLLTGLNHHSAGMGWLADIDSGYPGYRGDLTQDAATLAEVLRDAGWSTLLVGKWHVNNAASTGANGPYTNWPTHRGFERAYWFRATRPITSNPRNCSTASLRWSRPTGRTTSPATTSPTARSNTSARRRRSPPTSRSTCTSPSRAPTRRCRRAAASATPIAAPTTRAGT